MFVGVDIGGTFTDLVVSEGGQLRIHKLLSTPYDPSEAMLDGLAAVGAEAGTRIAHGTTVATNAILERKGARTALVTTAGFRDVLLIGRQNRPILYTLRPAIPAPLIPRNLCYGIPERIDHTGRVLTPIDLTVLDDVINKLLQEGVEAVAVCLLYSYINPTHEYAIRNHLIAHGRFQAEQISLSCEVLPEFREYERMSTTALDAYVRPVMSKYLAALETQIPDGSHLWVMKSDGRVVSAKTAREQAVQTALSGPAAGVIGAFHLARLSGFDQIITLDIGGTSTDAALCAGGVTRRSGTEINGQPMRIRVIDIETIGAGGGSIASVDAGGVLRVGPESAGAFPGPVVYGRGGVKATVSDANMVLGRLDAEHFLGGQMTLEKAAGDAALARLGSQISMSGQQAALGIIEITNANIERALRRVSIARGYDPRQFTLMAFGGAGPLHACEVAERLGIPRVLIPLMPGVLCAFGLLAADVAREYSRTLLLTVEAGTLLNVRGQINSLAENGQADLLADGIAIEAIVTRELVDLRYKGQSYELSIPFHDDMTVLAERFHAAHERLYGHAMRNRSLELVNVRVEIIGAVEKPILNRENLKPGDGLEAKIGERDAIFRDGVLKTALYVRELLHPGDVFNGPALVFQLDTTILIPPGWLASVDDLRHLILEHQ